MRRDRTYAHARRAGRQNRCEILSGPARRRVHYVVRRGTLWRRIQMAAAAALYSWHAGRCPDTPRSGCGRARVGRRGGVYAGVHGINVLLFFFLFSYARAFGTTARRRRRSCAVPCGCISHDGGVLHTAAAPIVYLRDITYVQKVR